MDDELAFLNALIDQPESDWHRAVYADWLEERGDCRADFLRLLLAVKSMPPGAAELETVSYQLRELRTCLPLNWLRAVEPLTRLGPLSPRALSWLRVHGHITTLGELWELTADLVLELQGPDESILRELRDRLAALGLRPRSFKTPLIVHWDGQRIGTIEVTRMGRESLRGRHILQGQFVAEAGFAVCREWFEAAARFDEEYQQAAGEGDAYHPASRDWGAVVAGLTPHVKLPELGWRVAEFGFLSGGEVEVYFTEQGTEPVASADGSRDAGS